MRISPRWDLRLSRLWIVGLLHRRPCVEINRQCWLIQRRRASPSPPLCSCHHNRSPWFVVVITTIIVVDGNHYQSSRWISRWNLGSSGGQNPQPRDDWSGQRDQDGEVLVLGVFRESDHLEVWIGVVGIWSPHWLHVKRQSTTAAMVHQWEIFHSQTRPTEQNPTKTLLSLDNCRRMF